MTSTGPATRHDAPASLPCSAPAARGDIVEQAMRLTDDDLLVVPFTTCAPGSRDFFTAVGRLLCVQPGTIASGTPLHRWSAPEPSAADADWRQACPEQPRSLWGELAVLRVLVGSRPGLEPLSELHALREAAR